MPRAKRSIQSAVTIDGFPLIWRLHREEQWCTSDGWKGVAIHVKVAERARRELYMEFQAVSPTRRGCTVTCSARPEISTVKVEAHIRQAMAAGWDPGSRGKPIYYQVNEFPS
jgi:hypothetical protein